MERRLKKPLPEGEATADALERSIYMDYNNYFLNPQRRVYARRRAVALLLVGIPMELLAIKILGIVIQFFLYAGIF